MKMLSHAEQLILLMCATPIFESRRTWRATTDITMLSDRLLTAYYAHIEHNKLNPGPG